MGKNYLIDLINRMADVTHSQSSYQSISWYAHREAEEIDDVSVLPLLQEFIMTRNSKEETRLRDSAYFILGKVLRNIMVDEYCNYFIRRLTDEEDKYLLMNMLDRIADLNISEDADISPIIMCSKNDKWQIRHSGIRALQASSTKKSRNALLFWVNQDDEKKFQYEITYANSALNRIGMIEDIPFIEKHAYSKKRDVRESAILAIESIKSRKP
ncbi:hypothetical protein T472_0206715 [Youngiibacter fragilis 232.1]|uniref:HEAT repeat domain-containing protein n=2 Tax=Youngiibacter TaxID=1408818 RepID=V7I809_9CLOT|nr:hypothetical protein T472_0206715 [Youngiibacter fragilis 232.1]